MFIIIGLGNPGKKYTNTRHNIGFRIVDEFRGKNNFPDFKLSKKFNALISKDILKGKKILLVKPQTFMNNSGKAIKKILSNVNCQMSNVIIVHDDIDLPLEKIKVVENRGSAGHKGVESIIKELGTKNFIRIRIGIQSRMRDKSKNAESFVLKKFNQTEKKIIKEIVEKSVEVIESLISNGLEKMNKFSK